MHVCKYIYVIRVYVVKLNKHSAKCSDLNNSKNVLQAQRSVYTRT